MREQFGFSCARELIFGTNGIKRLGKIVKKLGCKHPLLITDPGVRKTDLVERAVNPLKEAGIDFRIFEQGEPEPPIEVVYGRVELPLTG